jgi:uncharacterized membrane protein
MANPVKKTATYLLGIFFIIAGINHFVMPEFYHPLIPDYFPFPVLINYAAGIAEILLGLGVLVTRSRYYASLGIVVLMIMFIPSHVYFIVIGSCVDDGLCVHPAIAWIRLVVIHPLLIMWAWWCRK